MLLMIPVEMLETFICSFCSRYLTVKPIKIYKNRKMKCGRCPEIQSDTGVDSIYNMIAEKCIFKCKNRFEGCRELLTYDNVLKHEETCLSTKSCCPICFEEMWIYLMWNHLKLKHRDMILTDSYLFLQLKYSPSERQIFVYNNLNYLFCIQFSYNVQLPLSENTTEIFKISFQIKATLLGNNPREVVGSQTFLFKFDSNYHFKTKETPLFAHNSNKLEFSCIEVKLPELIKSVIIGFDLKIENNYEIVKLPQIKYCDRCKDKTLTVHHLETDNSVILKHKEYLCYGNIYISCYLCKELSTNSNTYYRGKFLCKNNKYHFICYYCFLYNKIFYDENSVEPRELLLYSFYSKVFFYCQWNCGKFFNNTDLYNHEINCEKQPLFKCVETCDMMLTFIKFKKHFNDLHHFSVLERIYYFCGSEFSIQYLPEPKWPFCLCFVKLPNNDLYRVKFDWYQMDLLIEIKSYAQIDNKNLKLLLFNNDSFWGSVQGKGGKLKILNEFNVKCYVTSD